MTILNTLIEALGADKVHSDDQIANERRHDYWFLSALNEAQGRKVPNALCVARPTSVDEVVAVVNACRAAAVPLIPFGLGSGVCGGVIARSDAVVLDMSNMNQVKEIDPVNLIASFEAGLNGARAEELCNEKGLTIGHFPQSIALSTVGGWVSTRASGQYSSTWGNIEDIIYSIEAVMPDGSIVTYGKAPRAAAGPDLRHILMGAEGTLGIVTSVSFSLRRKAEKQVCQAFYAQTFADGIEAQRQMMHQDWAVPVMRLYDDIESKRHAGDDYRDGCGVLMLVHEGPAEKVDVEVAAVKRIALGAGLLEAPGGITERWLVHRNHVPSWDELIEKGLVVDTIEISSAWTEICQVYEDAVAALKKVPGNFIASAHSSHAYRSGINLYFTFVAQPEDATDMSEVYMQSWNAVLKATAKNGGGIAHHHGIGRVRKDHLVHDLGDAGLSVLEKIKTSLDPQGIMNPGVLIPDA